MAARLPRLLDVLGRLKGDECRILGITTRRADEILNAAEIAESFVPAANAGRVWAPISGFRFWFEPR